jgi:DNA-binding XRE family transcriptional regulator
MQFSEKLKSLRTERRMSQSALAEQLGVTLRTVQHYEAGTRLPKNMLTTDRICKLFCVSQNELFSEEDCYAFITSECGSRAKKQAEAIVMQTTGLFAGGTLEEDDMDSVFRAITEAYWIAKEKNKKHSVKEYKFHA